MLRPLVPLALLTAGCLFGHDVVIEDEGTVCVNQLSPATLDSPLGLIEVSSPCVSACATNVSASCEVGVSGDVVTIRSRFAYDDTDGACIALCGQLQARCDMPTLPPGSYTVRHGDDLTTLEAGGAPLCFGSE